MTPEEIRAKAEWLVRFYQGVADGGMPQINTHGGSDMWRDSPDGPDLCCDQECWRVVYPPRKFWLNCGTMEYTGRDEVVAVWKEKGYTIIEAVEVLP